GGLTDDPGAGRVRLEPEVPRGTVPRDDVAAVLAELLRERAAIGRTLELVSGDTPIPEAVAALR
ncbi:NAD-dependent dehydratase, partial [Nonomuraea sp. NPDC050691]